MARFKDNYIWHLLKVSLTILWVIKLTGISAVYNSVQQVVTNQSNLEFHNAGEAFMFNKTRGIVNKTWLSNRKDYLTLNLNNYRKVNHSHIYKRDVKQSKNNKGSNSILEVKSRLWDCSYSFNDWCALKIAWLVEKRCTLLRQLKEVLSLLKERKNLLSQLGYTTKLVDITTYFVFMNDHISDVNEQLSKIVYSTSVFEAFEPDWASKAREVIDKWSDYNAYY